MEKELILVDTNVLIDSFRGKEKAKKDLESIRGRIAVSAITVMELYRGARTTERKEQLEKQLKAFYIVNIDLQTCITAIEIMKNYVSGKQDVFVADCLIAASAISNNLTLFTYNSADFNFINDLKLFK